MRSLARLVVLAPLALGSPLLAAEGDAPPARPAAAGQAQGAPRVAVLPFVAGTKDAETNNLGSTVQQGLVSELSSSGGVQASAVKGSATDATEAANQARDAGARYVVFGTVQSVNGQVRMTGQVYDAQAGRTVAPLKATGPANNFFAVQDDIARQAQAALGVAPSPATAGQPMYGSAYGSPAGAGAVDSGSHWAGYENAYATAPSAPSYPPPMAPPPPFYGNGGNGNFGYGYGGYFDGFGYGGGIGFVEIDPGSRIGGLGTQRIERFGQLGVSNAPPPPTASNTVRSVGAGSFLPTPVMRTPIPAYARPVQDYRSPNTRFPSPVGVPQRVAPPNLRPGAAPVAPAAVRK